MYKAEYCSIFGAIQALPSFLCVTNHVYFVSFFFLLSAFSARRIGMINCQAMSDLYFRRRRLDHDVRSIPSPD